MASPIEGPRACLEEDLARPDVRRCLHLYDRRVGRAVRKSGFGHGPADVLQRARDSEPAEANIRVRMHLQAPGIRSISRAASVRHCAEDLATEHSGPLPKRFSSACFGPLADLTEISAVELGSDRQQRE